MAGREAREMAEANSPRERRRSIGALIRCRNDASLVPLMPAAVGSYSFAAIQQAIKNPLVAGQLIADGVNAISWD